MNAQVLGWTRLPLGTAGACGGGWPRSVVPCCRACSRLGCNGDPGADRDRQQRHQPVATRATARSGSTTGARTAVQGNPAAVDRAVHERREVGQCVELEQGSATVNGTLRSGADLRLDNATNTISQGDTDPRVAQIQWLLQSSYRAAAVGGPNFTNGVDAGRAPERRLEDHEPDRRGERHRHLARRCASQADALADQLLAAAQANSGAVNPATWSLTIQGGNDPTCAGTTRTVQVKGEPEHGRQADDHRRHGPLPERHADDGRRPRRRRHGLASTSSTTARRPTPSRSAPPSRRGSWPRPTTATSRTSRTWRRAATSSRRSRSPSSRATSSSR